MSQPREPLPTLGEICTDVAAGSMVLARRVPALIGLAWRLLVKFSEGIPDSGPADKQDRKGTGKRSATVKGKKKAEGEGKAGKAKPDEKPDAAETPTSSGAEGAEATDTTDKAADGKDRHEKGPKKEAKAAKERSGGDLLEQLGLGAFTVIISWVFLHPYLTVLVRALAPAALPIFGTAVVLWIVAAYRAAPLNDHDGQAAGEGGGEGEEQEKGRPDPEAVREAERWLWTQVISRVQQAVAGGRKGVHLSALLQEPEFPDGWDVTRLRAHCVRLGIPTKLMQIRGSGITGPTHGVHVDQLTAKLGMPLAQALQRLPKQPALHPQGFTFHELLEASFNTVFGAAVEAPAEHGPGAPHEAAPTPSPGERRRGLRARLHQPGEGAHPPPARTPVNAAARPSPEPDPQPLPEDGRSPGETPSTTPI